MNHKNLCDTLKLTNEAIANMLISNRKHIMVLFAVDIEGLTAYT
jgi:hypothetical protein